MKKILLIILLSLPLMAISQGYTGDYFRARNYIKSPVFLQNTDTISTKNYVDLMYDSTFVHTGSFSRCAAYDVTTINTWLEVKFDTACAENTTNGFKLNSDSTGIICYFNGAVQISGHAKLLNNSAGGITASVYFRLKKNGVEVSQFNTAINRTFGSGACDDLVSVAGFLIVNYGDELTAEGRFNNANIDLQGVDGGIFDNNPAFTLYLSEIRKKDFNYPTLLITPSLSFDHNASSDTIFIEANSEWTASESLSWASLDKSSGTGNDTIIVTVTENNGSTNRTGSINVSSYGINRTCVASQKLIEVSPTNYNFLVKGGDVDIDIYTSVSWSASETSTWISLDKTSGTGDDSITVTVDENLIESSRIGNITITAGDVSILVRISQN